MAALLVSFLCLTAGGSTHAKDCAAPEEIRKSQATGVRKILFDRFATADSHGADCGSLASVLSKLAQRGKVGGKRLEEEKPVNLNGAQANLRAAQRDPAVRARLERVRAAVEDETMRLVYEAAILDEEGYYNARELLIQQLLQRLN
jgi:hypothetical protein